VEKNFSGTLWKSLKRTSFLRKENQPGEKVFPKGNKKHLSRKNPGFFTRLRFLVQIFPYLPFRKHLPPIEPFLYEEAFSRTFAEKKHTVSLFPFFPLILLQKTSFRTIFPNIFRTALHQIIWK